MKNFYRQKEAETGESYQAKAWVDYCKVTFPEGTLEVCEADGLVSADLAIPD